MSENDGRPRWTLTRRFEFIEWKLFWEGQVNRSDLEDTFAISTPQASVDLRNYREVAGQNIEYNSTEKGYLPSGRFSPKFLAISADRLLLQLRAFLTGALKREDLWFKDLPAVDMTPDIVRSVDPESLRKILRAIRTRQAIEVDYQSLTASRRREIGPHALAFDGHRWHARAWCCEHGDFRDFVLSRIEKIGDAKPVNFDPADDIEWVKTVGLRLCPHPGLSDAQKQAIQLDFGMTNGCREITVRLSLAYYFIKRMNLDLDHIEPQRAQIRLENRAEVDEAIRAAKDETARRVEMRKAEGTPGDQNAASSTP
ncbi:MAG: hypothetical protein JWL77_7140 [Chthonomonadaceae bacterium]|nr:hypothetical protein [Chthonomonadaceae bacterium]